MGAAADATLAARLGENVKGVKLTVTERRIDGDLCAKCFSALKDWLAGNDKPTDRKETR